MITFTLKMEDIIKEYSTLFEMDMPLPVIEWCEDNCRGRYIIYTESKKLDKKLEIVIIWPRVNLDFYYTVPVISFDNLEDATLFKLYWADYLEE